MIINNLFLSDTVQAGFLYLMLCLSGFCSLLLMRISITDSDHALKIGKILNLGRTGAFFAASSFIAVMAFYNGFGVF